MHVLDTNAVSELMKGNPRFLARLRQTERQAVVVPEPVWAELAYGIERLPRSKRRDRLQQRLALLRGELASLAWTAEVTDAFGRVKAALERRGQRLEDFDIAIAAHALAAQAVLITANGRHLGRVSDLVVEDWG